MESHTLQLKILSYNVWQSYFCLPEIEKSMQIRKIRDAFFNGNKVQVSTAVWIIRRLVQSCVLIQLMLAIRSRFEICFSTAPCCGSLEKMSLEKLILNTPVATSSGLSARTVPRILHIRRSRNALKYPNVIDHACMCIQFNQFLHQWSQFPLHVCGSYTWLHVERYQANYWNGLSPRIWTCSILGYKISSNSKPVLERYSRKITCQIRWKYPGCRHTLLSQIARKFFLNLS